MCTLSGTTRVCTPSGTVAPGGACGTSGQVCEAGAFCDLFSQSLGICQTFCTDDSMCVAPGGLCVITLQDGSGNPIPGGTLCSENCEPTTNGGCSVSGTGCSVYQEQSGAMRFFTACAPVGTGTQGAACTLESDCAATYGCINDGTSTKCLKYCNPQAPACPGATTCLQTQPPIVVGTKSYGFCL